MTTSDINDVYPDFFIVVTLIAYDVTTSDINDVYPDFFIVVTLDTHMT